MADRVQQLQLILGVDPWRCIRSTTVGMAIKEGGGDKINGHVMPKMSKQMIFPIMVGRYCGSNSVISTGPAAARSGQAILGKVKRFFFKPANQQILI